VGNDNVITRVTLRRFGEMGIVTSQRSNEISYVHVYDGGLIGLDNACIHADNTFVSCMNWTLPMEERANCTKVLIVQLTAPRYCTKVLHEGTAPRWYL
jgi:hypothetical protein